jgi:hypothetical protein
MSSVTRTNGRPPLAISTLNPLDVDLPESGNAWLTCLDCGLSVEVNRGLVQTHKANGYRCAGSAQVILFDLTAAQHAARRTAARHARRDAPGAVPAYIRKPTRVRPGPLGGERTALASAFEAAWEQIARTSTAPAVHQLAAARLAAGA